MLTNALNTNSYSTYLSNKNDVSMTKLSSANLNQNLVKDKSEAISEILGYGVDNEGFFTSDFNEAVGLPNDFRIYGEDIKNLLEKIQKYSTHYEIDIMQTLSNAYKLFSQLNKDNKSEFLQDELSEFPKAFSYNKTNFNIDKIYNSQSEIDKITLQENAYKSYIQNSISFVGRDSTRFSLDKIRLDVYSNDNKSVAVGGVFMAFVDSQLSQNAYYILEGETTITGKLLGYDKEMSAKEIDELNNFIYSNSFFGIQVSFEDFMLKFDKVLDLLNSNLSIDEFKTQWLNLISDKEAQGTSLEDMFEKIAQAQTNTQENNPNDNTFTPIQAESKNKETYTLKDDINKSFFLSFIENERKKGNDVLEFL